jgi:hypothetical protein
MSKVTRINRKTEPEKQEGEFTIGEALTLLDALTQLGALPGVNVKFAYAAAKNKAKLQGEQKAVQEGAQPSEKFLEFESKRIALCQEMVDKKEDGSPVMNHQGFVILKRKAEFDTAMESLSAEYQEAIDLRKEQIKAATELMEEPCKVELHKIDIELFPALSINQMEALLPMISETTT